MSAPTHFPPTSDPDARYDAVVRRGRELRRRRRLATTAGAGGGIAAGILALALIAGSLTGNGGGDELATTATDGSAEVAPTVLSPSEATGDPTGLSRSEGAPAEVPTVAIEGDDMQVGAPRVDGDVLTVVVVDPAQPLDVRSRICVLVTMTSTDGQPGAEGTACTAGPGDGEADGGLGRIDPVLGGAQVGCAAVLRPDPIATGPTERATASFRLRLPADLPPGEWAVTTNAVSGIGDGCPPAMDVVELERITTSTALVRT
jgi:hypothetical protein